MSPQPEPRAVKGYELRVGDVFQVSKGSAPWTVKALPVCVYGNVVSEALGKAGINLDDSVFLVSEAATPSTLQEPQAMSSQPVKRSLPFVTLQDIYNVLKARNACWAKEGDLVLADRLFTLRDRLPQGTSKFTLRSVQSLLNGGHINGSEAHWLVNKLGAAICPAELHLDSTWADIDAWENPKPPEKTFGDFPVGTVFKLRDTTLTIINPGSMTVEHLGEKYTEAEVVFLIDQNHELHYNYRRRPLSGWIPQV